MKGLIVAAGYGTRFLPATKTVPKEMLPIIDKPTIAFIIEEFINSGIKDIVIITSRRKKALEDYTDREVELEVELAKKGKQDLLELIKPYDANFTFVRQKEMRGTGHAMLAVASVIGDHPFVVAYPDDLHFGPYPLAKQLIDLYEKTGCSVLATIHNPPELHDYASIKIDSDNLHVLDMIEKPPIGMEFSKEASIGRFLYTPDIFTYLREGWEKHTSGEYYHVYALKRQMQQRKVVYKQLEGNRYDTGTPVGFLKATIAYAAKDPELLAMLKNEINSL